MSALDKWRGREDGTIWSYADLEEMADAAIAELQAEVERLNGIIHGSTPDPDSPEWYPWVKTAIGRCVDHGMELTNGSWHMHPHCKRELY